MLKSVLNLGNIITKKEQQTIKGGQDFETCAACFDDCFQKYPDRGELAQCFDVCQVVAC